MIERIAEKSLYASRWLLAPIYLGLSFGLLVAGMRAVLRSRQSLRFDGPSASFKRSGFAFQQYCSGDGGEHGCGQDTDLCLVLENLILEGAGDLLPEVREDPDFAALISTSVSAVRGLALTMMTPLRDGDAEWLQVRSQLLRLASRITHPEIA